MKSLVIGNAYSISDGGGINYSLGIANALEELGSNVDFTPGYKTTMESENNLLPKMRPNIHLINSDYVSGKSMINRLTNSVVNWLKYDQIFIQSTIIPDFTFNRKSFIVCDFPSTAPKTAANQFKLKTFKGVIANSAFTSGWIQNRWGVNSSILYPPISPIKIELPKENFILNVGRFALGHRSKNHLEMIQAFVKLYQQGYTNWELHLAGFIQDQAYFDMVKKEAGNYPVIFHTNIDRNQLEILYAKSSIYWHACGINADENKEPHLMEHFGISTAEALSAGCVPVVVNKGGQPEKATQDCGYTWNTLEESIKFTEQLILHPNLLKQLRAQARINSLKFQLDAFKINLATIIESN